MPNAAAERAPQVRARELAADDAARDAQRPHEVYFWKAGPFYKFEATGPPTGLNAAAIDYLYAFWVMRYYRLYERYHVEAS